MLIDKERQADIDRALAKRDKEWRVKAVHEGRAICNLFKWGVFKHGVITGVEEMITRLFGEATLVQFQQEPEAASLRPMPFDEAIRVLLAPPSSEEKPEMVVAGEPRVADLGIEDNSAIGTRIEAPVVSRSNVVPMEEPETVDCPKCHGVGSFVSTAKEIALGGSLPGTVTCGNCGGTGKVLKEE